MNNSVSNLLCDKNIISNKMQKYRQKIDQCQARYNSINTQLYSVCPHPQNMIKYISYGESVCMNCNLSVSSNNR